MERVTLRVPQKQMEILDVLVELGDFPSVSEAVRAAVRNLIERRCGKFVLRGTNVFLSTNSP